ncbi:MAG: hypothetical protein P8123_08295, partial [bacterium]
WKIKNMAITGESPDKKFSFDIYTALTGTPTDYKICEHSLRVLYDNTEIENPVVPAGLSMFYANMGSIERWDDLGYFYPTPMYGVSGVIVELFYEIAWGEYASQGYTASLLPLLSSDGEQLLCRVVFDVINDDTFTIDDAGIDWDKASYGFPHFDSTVGNKYPDESCGMISDYATYAIEMPAPTPTPTPSLKLEAKIILEGAYTGGIPLMYTALQTLGYLPATSPYADGRVVSAIPPDVVDWVYVELREDYKGMPVAERSAFVSSDGRLVDDDGNAVVNIPYLPDGDYYVIVRHRNHLAVMSRDPISLSLDSSTLYDFTDNQRKAYGNKAMKDLGDGNYALVAGDVAKEFGIVDASDQKAIDRSSGETGYLLADVNLQGVVDAADRAMCYNNCGEVSKVPKPKVKRK